MRQGLAPPSTDGVDELKTPWANPLCDFPAEADTPERQRTRYIAVVLTYYCVKRRQMGWGSAEVMGTSHVDRELAVLCQREMEGATPKKFFIPAAQFGDRFGPIPEGADIPTVEEVRAVIRRLYTGPSFISSICPFEEGRVRDDGTPYSYIDLSPLDSYFGV